MRVSCFVDGRGGGLPSESFLNHSEDINLHVYDFAFLKNRWLGAQQYKFRPREVNVVQKKNI